MAYPTGLPNFRRVKAWLAGMASKVNGHTPVITLAAGANNVMGVTIKVTDEKGATVTGVHLLEVWATDLATGLGLTASAFSGDLVATAGVILNSPTAKKQWRILTAATGIFTGNLTDSAEPQALYIACKNPLGGGITVSAISAGKFG